MKTLVLAAAAFAVNIAHAIPIEVWHGSMNMNLAPCSTVEWRNDGPFGTPSPTVVTATQVKEGSISVYVNDVNEWTDQVRRDCEECAFAGVAAATAAALFSWTVGAWPAFQSTFYGCLISRVQAYRIVQDIELRTENRCLW